MFNWYQQKRASLLELVVYQTTFSQEQGSSHGQYTQASSSCDGTFGGWLLETRVRSHRRVGFCGNSYFRSAYHRQRFADGAVACAWKLLGLPSSIVAAEVGSMATGASFGCTCTQAVRSEGGGVVLRRRHGRRASWEESLWQGLSSRCRTLHALLHGVPL